MKTVITLAWASVNTRNRELKLKCVNTSLSHVDGLWNEIQFFQIEILLTFHFQLFAM